MSDTQEQKPEMAVEETTGDMLAPTQPTEQPTTNELPQEVSERTRAEFEKLKAHNKQLAEELAATKAPVSPKGSVFDELRPKTPVAPVQTETDLVNEEGFVDAEMLKKLAEEAKQAKLAAESTRQEFQRYQETQVLRDVYKDFPQLNPNNAAEYDERFFELTKLKLVDQMLAGKPQDLQAAAAEVATLIAPKAKVESTSKAEKEIVNQSFTNSRAPSVDMDDLVQKTRNGDFDALAERLRRSGY